MPSQVAFLDIMGNGIPHIAVGGQGGLAVLLNQTN
jgi:hypothetical protein